MSRNVARWLSRVFHPFVMVSIMAGAAAARHGSGGAARSIAVVALFMVVPLFTLMVLQVRRGAWENIDASNSEERPILYFVGGAAATALLVYVAVVRPESFMVRGVAATLGLIIVCGVATRWIKVSLHMAFAAFSATTLVLMRSPVGYLLLPVVPALAWSRLALGRHTPPEVVLGTIVGAGAGALIHYI